MSQLIAVLRRGLFAVDVTLPFPVAAPAPRSGRAGNGASGRSFEHSACVGSHSRPIDPLLVEASARGELAVARVRLGTAAALLVIPVSALVESRQTENLIGLGGALAAVLLSVVVDALVTRRLSPLVSVATSAVDVSIVSATLVAFLVLVHPHTAVNSKVVFECYFLPLGAATLRYDVRICLFAGLLALAARRANKTHTGSAVRREHVDPIRSVPRWRKPQRQALLAPDPARLGIRRNPQAQVSDAAYAAKPKQESWGGQSVPERGPHHG